MIGCFRRSAVPEMSYEDPEHWAVEAVSQLCEGDQVYAAYLQVRIRISCQTNTIW